MSNTRNNEHTDEEKLCFAYLCERYIADALVESEAGELLRLIEHDPGLMQMFGEHLLLQLEVKAVLAPYSINELLKNDDGMFCANTEMERLALYAVKQSTD